MAAFVKRGAGGMRRNFEKFPRAPSNFEKGQFEEEGRGAFSKAPLKNQIPKIAGRGRKRIPMTPTIKMRQKRSAMKSRVW